MVNKRADLRKGKWTAEEEEYTQRIIDYFNEGLVPLPEGVTLRAYLADKLSCDPMRITKKFTGSACLGKRIYQAASRKEQAPAFDAVTKAHAHLRQLEARFLNRLERSKHKEFCGIVELDPAFYNHPNIISTPAIDALIQQARHDPNFWVDSSDVESAADFDEEVGEEEEEEEKEAAAALFLPALDQQEERVEEALLTFAAAAVTSHRQHEEVKAEMVEAACGMMSAFPSMTSVSDMMLLEPPCKKGRSISMMSEGQTDGSECGSGSDSEHEHEYEVPVSSSYSEAAVGDKRPRWQQQQQRPGPVWTHGQFYEDMDELERRPHLSSSSSSTSSSFSVRTLSEHSSGGSQEDEQEAEASARQMLQVVGHLRKRGSHEDLVSFVCEVNQQPSQQQQQQQQLQQLATAVHCI